MVSTHTKPCWSRGVNGETRNETYFQTLVQGDEQLGSCFPVLLSRKESILSLIEDAMAPIREELGVTPSEKTSETVPKPVSTRFKPQRGRVRDQYVVWKVLVRLDTREVIP